MPTVYFIFYILAAAGAYIFKLGYLGWFGTYFFLAVVFTPPFLLLISLPGMLRMRLRVSVPHSAQCGAALRLCAAVRIGLIPVGRLSLLLRVTNVYTGKVTERRLHWDNLSAEALYLTLPSDECGRLKCEISDVRCTDILRLVSVRRPAPPAAECIVMPPVIAPDGIRDISAELEARTVLKPKPGGGYSEEHELREYRPGDMVNSIHWKLSSKTDKTIVREPLTSDGSKVYLIVSGSGTKALGNARSISLSLCELEQEHELVSAAGVSTVGNAQESERAFMGLLSVPQVDARSISAANSRCCFIVSDEGVSIK